MALELPEESGRRVASRTGRESPLQDQGIDREAVPVEALAAKRG
jgi:hypothetical protein